MLLSASSHLNRARLAFAGAVYACLVTASIAQTAAAPKPATTNISAASGLETGVRWENLTAAQQQALKPIQSDWASLDNARKKKWLAVAQRYAHLPDTDKAQMHSRMQAWSQLSPAQRQSARDNYTQALSSPSSVPAGEGQKANLNEQWIKYQALPPEKRAALKAAAEGGKPPGSEKAKSLN